MSTFTAPLTSDTVRQLLHAFWQESLEIVQTRQGISLAMPQIYQDGWQIVVDLDDHLPAGLKATDQGRTLGWLVAHGQNIETEAVESQLDGRTREKVKLDYFIPEESPIAFQIIRRHGRIFGTMEQWGFRWNDLPAAHPKLRPAMIYDPPHHAYR